MNTTYAELCPDDAPTLRLDLDVTPEAPSLARAAITGFSEHREIGPAQLALLNLLVSEVVTNAVVHARVTPATKIGVAACLTEGLIRVEVTDRGAGFTPVARDPTRSDGGYGLFLLQQQARRWGVEQRNGTTVWFELARAGADDL